MLNPPESPRERRQRVAEERAAASRAAGGHESDGRNFISRVLGRDEGRTVAEVIQRFATAPDRAGDEVSDIRRARQILDQHGLSHVLPGRIQAVFSDNGILDSPRHQPDPDLPRDVELGRMREDLDANERWMRRYVERRDEAVRSRGGRRRPLAVRSDVAVTCPECIAVGATAEQSFLIHHTDADGNLSSSEPEEERREHSGRTPMIYR